MHVDCDEAIELVGLYHGQGTMLVAGKARLLAVTALVVLGFIAIVALSYNPSFTDDSTSYLRKWSKISHEQAPAWLLQGEKNIGDGQETITQPPPPPDTEDLPSKNPNPAAALNEAEGTLSSSEHYKNEPADPASALASTNKDEHDHAPASQTDVKKKYHQLFSRRTKDRKYFSVTFGEGIHAINPNIIPHPRLEDTWIVMAQEFVRDKPFFSGWCAELVCDARFDERGDLMCIAPPKYAPIQATQSSNCLDGLSFLIYNVGPHDARMFWGPRQPYVIYGSQSQFGCFGQWTQDFRLLYDWGHKRNESDLFQTQTEIQRPSDRGQMEKNWFFFWDFNAEIYAHYDSYPKRSFAKLERDGSAGPDLAPKARSADDACWAKHMELNPLPPLTEFNSSIHQASNSISLTFCKSTDPTCIASPDNTFIVQIFQHKYGTVHYMHAVYDPYVMIFKMEAPFDMHAISAKPLWINGRTSVNEMIFITSMSWKSSERQYHGYLDDVLFLNFGIEDQKTASIDVTAADLVGDLMLCKKHWKS